MNRWNIPPELERVIIGRDQACVYCGVSFATPSPARGCRPSWEHIINNASIVTLENIARCCMSCNASKGAKDLTAWMPSRYCMFRGITASSVAPVIKAALTKATRFGLPSNH